MNTELKNALEQVVTAFKNVTPRKLHNDFSSCYKWVEDFKDKNIFSTNERVEIIQYLEYVTKAPKFFDNYTDIALLAHYIFNYIDSEINIDVNDILKEIQDLEKKIKELEQKSIKQNSELVECYNFKNNTWILISHLIDEKLPIKTELLIDKFIIINK